MTNKKRIILYVILAVFIGITIATFLYVWRESLGPLTTKTVYMDVTVVDGGLVGFNVNTSALNFGRVPAGGYAKKWIVVRNDYSYPVKIVTMISGNITPFISSSNYTFYLGPGQYENVSVSCSPNLLAGYYEGYLGYDIYKVK